MWRPTVGELLKVVFCLFTAAFVTWSIADASMSFGSVGEVGLCKSGTEYTLLFTGLIYSLAIAILADVALLCHLARSLTAARSGEERSDGDSEGGKNDGERPPLPAAQQFVDVPL